MEHMKKKTKHIAEKKHESTHKTKDARVELVRTKLRAVWQNPYLLGLLLVLFIPLTSLLVFELYFWDRVMPGVYLNDVQLGGRSRQDALQVLDQQFVARQDAALMLVHDGKVISQLDSGRGLVAYDKENSLQGALAIGRNRNYLVALRERFFAMRDGARLSPVMAYDRDAVYRALDNKLRAVETKAVNAKLVLNGQTVAVDGGTEGFEAKKDGVIGELGHFWSFTRKDNQINVELSATQPQLTRQELEALVPEVQTIVSRKLVVSSQELYREQFPIEGREMFELLSVNEENGKAELRFDDYKVAERFNSLAEKVKREPVDAQFQFEDDRAVVFQPSLDGTVLDTQTLAKDLLAAARDTGANATVEAPLKRTPPAITTASVNQYGIKEKVGTGHSRFRGSAAGRIHNVALASQKLNGVLIAPDEVFSMYKAVGEIEKETGFKDAFIIKDGRTIPGVGGGVCQVSTTLFRTILDAGLPVVERKPHAYRVSYYEQDSPPGLDAAVYFPSWDLKFKNDTGNYLLLETKVDTKALTAEFNLYGVGDGRAVTMTKPVVTGQTPPPPDLYTDDPNLARGTTVQDEHAAWGATVTFDRTVMKNGATLLKDTFKSGYKPWQAVFRVGVKDN